MYPEPGPNRCGSKRLDHDHLVEHHCGHRSVVARSPWFKGRIKRLQEKLETWDTADARLELDAIHQNLFLRESEWREVLNRDGISVSTTWTQSTLVGKNIRTYRTLSKLHADEISMDRILDLLDGGFLDEEVWFKDDYLGMRVRSIV